MERKGLIGLFRGKEIYEDSPKEELVALIRDLIKAREGDRKLFDDLSSVARLRAVK